MKPRLFSTGDRSTSLGSAAFCLAIVCFATGASAATSAKSAAPKVRPANASQKKALDRVEREYKKYGQNVSGLKKGCYEFSLEQATSSAVTVLQKEVHGKKCGGDPASSPTIATYVVRGTKVFIEDPVSGDTIPFNAKFKSDGP